MKRFKDILCVIDPNAVNDAMLERAAKLAKNNQANVTVVSVVDRVTAGINMPDGGPISFDLQAAVVEKYERVLQKSVEFMPKNIPIRVKVLQGMEFIELIREVIGYEHDLVIKSPDPQNWIDRLFGSGDMHLLRKCPCPVWMVKPEKEHGYRRIVAAVDIDIADLNAQSESSRLLNQMILEMAGSLALSEFAELHVVNVWEAMGEGVMRSSIVKAPDEEIEAYVESVRDCHMGELSELMDYLAARLGKQAADYLEPQKHLIRGWARKEIPEFVKTIDADLIVMGTVARTGIPGLIMGNTAESILGHINCSVLAVKPEGFVSPVTLSDKA